MLLLQLPLQLLLLLLLLITTTTMKMMIMVMYVDENDGIQKVGIDKELRLKEKKLRASGKKI